MEKTVFKKGDRVFHIEYGWGEIDEVDSGRLLHVRFDCGSELFFYIDGKMFPSSKISLLSFTEYTLEGFSKERPIELPVYGECVFYSFDDETWQIASIEKYSYDEVILKRGTKYGTTETFQCNNIKRFVNC